MHDGAPSDETIKYWEENSLKKITKIYCVEINGIKVAFKDLLEAVKVSNEISVISVYDTLEDFYNREKIVKRYIME